MIKIALCKTYILGSPVLLLGVCRTFQEGDEHWTLSQLHTVEDYLDIQYKYDNTTEWCAFHSQEEADRESELMRETARSYSRLHGDSLHFEKLNKTLQINKQSHNFNLNKAQAVEITLEELKLLQEDMRSENWMEFDWESWAK